MQIRTKIGKQEGTSLIEVLILLFLIASMLVLYGAAVNTLTMSKRLRNENYAYHIANKQMEELREQNVTALPASGTITDPMLANIPSSSGDFTVTNHGVFTGLKELTVTVSWNDGRARQIQLKSVAGSGGINP
ncbi:MAG: type IV pilus modification PilV family protein [Acidobacteriaceae bacterium]